MTPEPGKKGGGLGAMLGASKASEDEAAPSYDDGKKAAAQAAMDAFNSGDVDALESALTDFVNLCM